MISEHTGIDEQRLGALLSFMPEVVRATKDEWGLESCVEDPYEGVVAEIVQRIDEGGGRTTVELLLTEIPARFQVSPGTVITYLSTPKFDVRDGWVRLADVAPTFPPLEALREIFWDSEGRPVLRFTAHENHLEGYSLAIPPAVARYLGVGIDKSTIVPVLDPPACASASVIWRAHSPSGPEIGRLREALIEASISAGDEVFLVLDPAGLVITTSLADFSAYPPSKSEEAFIDKEVVLSHNDALERMKSRRRL